jgi:nucleotide-binding universal stress UspA family protein
MTLDHILLAVGPGDAGSATTLAEPIEDIAAPAGASVTIVHVFDEGHFEDLQTNLPSGSSQNQDPDALARRHATIRHIVRRLEEAGVDYNTRGEVGEPAEEVVGLARRVEPDMVVVGGQGRSPTGKALFGSTAQEVLRRAEPPVLFVKRTPRGQTP